MTAHNVITDLANITRVPNKSYVFLTELMNKCIASAIANSKVNGETELVLNIGIGTLSVNLIDGQCKFIPSKELKQEIREAATTGSDPISTTFETAVVAKLLNICDEVI